MLEKENAEFVDLMARAAWNGRQAADALGSSEAIISGYVTGKKPVPEHKLKLFRIAVMEHTAAKSNSQSKLKDERAFNGLQDALDQIREIKDRCYDLERHLDALRSRERGDTHTVSYNSPMPGISPKVSDGLRQAGRTIAGLALNESLPPESSPPPGAASVSTPSENPASPPAKIRPRSSGVPVQKQHKAEED